MGEDKVKSGDVVGCSPTCEALSPKLNTTLKKKN